MITNETTKNLNLAKHPFGLGNGEYYIGNGEYYINSSYIQRSSIILLVHSTSLLSK